MSRTYHLEHRLGSALEKEIDQLRGVLWSERDPQGRVFVPLADAYRRMGDLPLARSMIEEGLERLPDFASAHVVAGWIHQDLVSPVEAERAFRRVLELDPENTIALEAMGGLAGARGSHAESAEYLRRLAALDPSHGERDEQGVQAQKHGGPATVQPTAAAAASAAVLASAGILLDDAEGEDDARFEEINFDDGGSDEDSPPVESASQLSADEGAPADPDATDEIAVADLAPDDDAAPEDQAPAQILVADLAPDDEEVPPDISVADLAPDRDEALGAIAITDLAPGHEEAGPDPLASMPVGGLAPDVVEAGTDEEPAALDIGQLAPSVEEEMVASETRVAISDLAPDEVASVDEDAALDAPFDFAVADLSGETAPAADEVSAGAADEDSGEAESWVEPVGEFLAQEAPRGDDELVEDELSVSSVFRSLLEYEPLPASEELTDGETELVADWNWSPIEAAASRAGESEEDVETDADSTRGGPSAASEGDRSTSDSDEPGPDDFQAWLERNSL